MEKKGWRRVGRRGTRVANLLFPLIGNSNWNWTWVCDWNLIETWRSKISFFLFFSLIENCPKLFLDSFLVPKLFLSSWKALYVTVEVNSLFLIMVIIGRDHENLPSEHSTAIPGSFCLCWYWFQLKQVIWITGLPVGCTHCPVMQMESLFQTYGIWLLTTRPRQLGYKQTSSTNQCRRKWSSFALHDVIHLEPDNFLTIIDCEARQILQIHLIPYQGR